VIGPLVLAGVVIEETQCKLLSELGVKDSKRLSRPQRNALVPTLTAVAREIKVLVIPPHKLKGNLTQVELDAMAQLIRDSHATTVYLDAPVPPRGISRYASALCSRVGRSELTVIAENKADEKYGIVSAASIVAKVHRDRLIERLREQHGDFGWGYPSEPKTRQFLAEWYRAHGAFPECVRHRWRTVRRLIQDHKERGFFANDDR